MSRLTGTVIRWFAKLENTRFGVDAVAGFLGFVFFSFTVGIEKLDPRNVGWLIHGDQQQHLLGWFFYASDRWRWPLGANPNWGWEGTNSIVYTDSWPGLAVIFKLLDIDAVNRGQYFGFGFLIGAIALFVGARRLFHSVGLLLLPSLVASGLLVTTSVFWWMQRWYPALSAGVPILVWALFLYAEDTRNPTRLCRRWSTLLVIAVATHAYLAIAAIPLLLASVTRRVTHSPHTFKNSLINLGVIGIATTLSMSVLGYFTLPSKWAQTGGYGWYSANVLGLFDSNNASRILPDLPSLSGQYEPTALGLGVLALLVALVVHRVRTGMPFGVSIYVKQHAPLIVVLGVLALMAVTNTVSIGAWSFQVPLPARLQHVLSIVRSSTRLLWPALIAITTVITVFSIRRLRYGFAAVSLALVVQVVDSIPELRGVAVTENGTVTTIVYDENFWGQIPETYTKITSLPAQSLGFDWAACALAAVNTGRRAECGYFSRVQGLENVNRLRTTQILSGAPETNVVYMLSRDWLDTHRLELRSLLERRGLEAVAAANVAGFSPNTIFVFPKCVAERICESLRVGFPLSETLLRESGS